MTRSARVIILAAAFLGLGVVAGAQAPANDDVLLQAMREELGRAASQLKLANLDRPFYLEATVSDQETVNISASFGALVRVDRERSRPLRVEVRTGSYELDSGEFVGTRSFYALMMDAPRRLVVEDDTLALRHALWLAFDTAYKQALEQLAAKKATLQNKVNTEQIPDFSREKPVTAVAPRQPLGTEFGKWPDVVRRLSTIFREFPAIQDSGVQLTLRVGSHYYVTSEGTVLRQPDSLATLLVRASTQAPDGMQLKDFAPFLAANLDQLPPEPVLAAAVRTVGGQLTSLAAAPALEKFAGPVLFTGQAAAELFAQLLAPQLSGHRPPLVEDERMAAGMPRSELAERLNRPVLPAFFSVTDDPRQASLAGQALMGTYAFDSQGVPAQAVTLIDGGVLKALLMSRRPRKEIPQSNGHGRALAYGGVTAQMGNLFVQAKDGKDLPELKAELLEACKATGLPEGLIITKLDDPALSGGDPSARVRRRPDPVAAPILAYRVSVADGKEELVRGLSFGEISVRTLKEITAAGNEPFVDNRTATASAAGGFTVAYGGYGGMAGVPAAVVAPSVLLPDLEFSRPPGPQQKPAILQHPYFAK
jgi:TldD protein